ATSPTAPRQPLRHFAAAALCRIGLLRMATQRNGAGGRENCFSPALRSAPRVCARMPATNRAKHVPRAGRCVAAAEHGVCERPAKNDLRARPREQRALERRRFFAELVEELLQGFHLLLVDAVGVGGADVLGLAGVLLLQ